MALSQLTTWALNPIKVVWLFVNRQLNHQRLNPIPRNIHFLIGSDFLIGSGFFKVCNWVHLGMTLFKAACDYFWYRFRGRLRFSTTIQVWYCKTWRRTGREYAAPGTCVGSGELALSQLTTWALNPIKVVWLFVNRQLNNQRLNPIPRNIRSGFFKVCNWVHLGMTLFRAACGYFWYRVRGRLRFSTTIQVWCCETWRRKMCNGKQDLNSDCLMSIRAFHTKTNILPHLVVN